MTGPNDRPPPQNREAEQSVLGAILIDNDSVWRVYGWLRPDHFWDPFHRTIYEIVCRFAENHDLIDIITVRDAIMALDPSRDPNGTAAAVAALVDGIPDVSGIARWGGIIKRDADRRRAIHTCERAAESFSVSQDVKANATALLDAATDLLDSGVTDKKTRNAKELAQEALVEIEKRLSGDSEPTGIPTGFRSIDSKTHGFPLGAVTIVGAPPKIGKTTFIMNCALNAAKAGKHVLMFSIDMPYRFVRDRLLSIEAGVDAEFVKTGLVSQRGLYGGVSRDELLSAVMAGGERLWKLPGTLDVNDATDDLAEIVAECTVRAKLGKLDVVFIDYVQQVQTGSSRHDSEHRRITYVAGRFRAMARQLNIAVVLAAQPNRTLSAGERMSLRHLAESSSLEQVPRLAIMLHRPGAFNGAEQLACDMTAIIEKNEGQTGDCALHAELWCYRITESEHDHSCYFDRSNQ